MVAQMVKNLPAIRETRLRSLSQEDPLEKGVANHSSILAWRIPWTEQLGGLQSMGSQRVRHDWVANTNTNFFRIGRSLFFFFFFFFWPHLKACGILSPWTGIGPGPLAMKAQSLNHLITREFEGDLFLIITSPFISGRTDAEAEALILWPTDAKSWLIAKDLEAGKDWRQEEKGAAEDEIVR